MPARTHTSTYTDEPVISSSCIPIIFYNIIIHYIAHANVDYQDHLYNAWCAHAPHKALHIRRKRMWRTAHAYMHTEVNCYVDSV